MTAVIANWKTTAAGVALLAVTLSFLLGRVDLQQYLAAVGVLGGVGLVLAQDAKKTG